MARRDQEAVGSSISQADVARIREAFDRSEIMVLSTVDEEAGTWTVPLQYQWNQEMHLFFSSLPGSRHVANLSDDDRVSAAIYSFPGPTGGNLGLQLIGRARRVEEEVSATGWIRFEVVPSEVWYFDSRADRRRHEVDLRLLQEAMKSGRKNPTGSSDTRDERND